MHFDINSIIGIGVLVAGLGYAYGQFFSGRSKVGKENTEAGIETLGYLRGQIEALQALVNSQKTESIERNNKHNSEIREMNGKIEHMTGQLVEKNKQVDEYKAIFQGRDPKMLELLGQLVANDQKNTETIEQIGKFMESINNFMSGMHDKVSLRKDQPNV